MHVFAGQVKIVSHLSSSTSAILKYFCPLGLYELQVNKFIKLYMIVS